MNTIVSARWSLPMSVEDFAHKQDGSLSNKNKWSWVPDLATVPSEMEQVTMGHSVHLNGYFDGSCQILELFSPFGRKKFQHEPCLRNLGLISE